MADESTEQATGTAQTAQTATAQADASEQAATRVHEAAANIHSAATPRERISDRSRGTLASGEHPRFGQPRRAVWDPRRGGRGSR
jgi:hypothetical protein